MKKDYCYISLFNGYSIIFFGNIKKEDTYISLIDRFEKGEVTMYRCKEINKNEIYSNNRND